MIIYILILLVGLICSVGCLELGYRQALSEIEKGWVKGFYSTKSKSK